MSTTSTLCQGLQSCLEPLLLEPRVLMHQLLPSKQRLSFSRPPIETNCWNFARNPTADEEDKGYVHPLSKCSFTSLSTKSLEMCTESLGSETGSDTDLTRDEHTHLESEKQSPNQPKRREAIRKVRQSSSFPPPLTSISGSEGVRVRPHREGGRLVIKAFGFASCGSYFQAERGNGRLRLSLLSDGVNEAEEKAEEEVEAENVDEAENEESGDEGGFREGRKEDGGKIGCKLGGGGEWSGSRCSGGRGSRKRLQKSLQCCMAIS